MKILFFLIAIANVALFMWEYKAGAFVAATETSEQSADLDQEQILLVSELKIVPQATPVSELPTAENAATGEAVKSAPAPGLLPAISESIAKPALEKPTAGDSNITDTGKIEGRERPTAENAATGVATKPTLAPELSPATPESIAKPVLGTSAVKDSTIAADKIAASCYEVGPFINDKTYWAWVSRLKGIKSEIKPVNRDEQVAGSYMVYYPAAETELASKENIKMLKNHGIKDLWTLSDEDKGKISLGLFAKEESALVMKNELLAKGINAEVKARYKTKPQKYALIKGGGQLMERLDDLKKTYPELQVKQIMDETQGCW